MFKILCIALLPFLASAEYLYGDNPYLHNTEYASHYDNYKPRDYNFGYGVSDPHTGDHKSQWEVRENGVVRGSYSLLEADGTTRIVDYYADDTGFHADVKKVGHAVHDGPHHQQEVQFAPIAKNQIVNSIAYNGYGHGGLDHGYGAPIAAPVAHAVALEHTHHVAPVQQVIVSQSKSPAQYFEQVLEGLPIKQYAQLAPAQYIQEPHYAHNAPIAPLQYIEKAPLQYIEKSAYAVPQYIESHQHQPQYIEKQVHVTPAPYLENVHHVAPQLVQAAPQVYHHEAPQYIEKQVHVTPAPFLENVHHVEQQLIQAPQYIEKQVHVTPAPYLEKIHQVQPQLVQQVHHAAPQLIQAAPQAYLEHIHHEAPQYIEKQVHVTPAPYLEKIHQVQPQLVQQVHLPQQYIQEQVHVTPAPYLEKIHQVQPQLIEKLSFAPQYAEKSLAVSPSPLIDGIHHVQPQLIQKIEQAPQYYEKVAHAPPQYVEYAQPQYVKSVAHAPKVQYEYSFNADQFPFFDGKHAY